MHKNTFSVENCLDDISNMSEEEKLCALSRLKELEAEAEFLKQKK